MDEIKRFLNNNPCLSQEWKDELLSMISKYIKDIPTPSNDTTSFKNKLSKLLVKHEGFRNYAYNDSLGIKSIGVGFNLERHDAKDLLSVVGANINDLYLTDDQVYKLLDITIDEAITHTKKIITSYDSHPEYVKLVLCDMMFNLGPNRFSAFKNMIRAVEQKDYLTAAHEMVNSKWYSQVGNRSKFLVEVMKGNLKL